ncbi:hypothetical protein SPSYN_02629 [Sporotomaculum syntrophicum]|uniref:Uncharacterized protein n=1 Tax=Sporotomaculum syntrophicum TaxID=182264 RepID=A0A9D2WMN7_9FIRM|nr:hypothetical protein [Sporotomaculum syntrophicum]KAF1084225.1 hypothetical protein SPSYN_02629 [Sporotomaculum syntrophicum]
MVFLLILAFIGIILFEIPSLIKKKMWRELAAFSLYLSIGMALSIPQAMGIILPNLSKAIEVLIKPISELLK